MPGGVFSLNDGIPTQMLLGLAGSRQSCDDIGIIDGRLAIDDDAYPDPHWLRFLAAAFVNTGHVVVGGPNIAPPGWYMLFLVDNNGVPSTARWVHIRP